MDVIKPRYKLGTQNMLEQAKTDATQLPANTLFRLRRNAGGIPEGVVVVRESNPDARLNDVNTVAFKDVRGVHPGAYCEWVYLSAFDLRPVA